MRTILQELTEALDRREPVVFCSLVETRGSTPQKAGAGMLIFPGGGQRGTLGGGCVEAEVKGRALGVLAADRAAPELFVFTLDDNYGWDDGLICGGRMTILAHPLIPGPAGAPPPHADYFRKLHQVLEEGRGGTEAIVLDRVDVPPRSRFLFGPDGGMVAATLPGPVPQGINAIALAERPGPSTVGGVAYLPTLPRITLVLVGAGHVGQAVARLAAEVDFDTWVVDDRESFASAQRFPSAKRLIVGELGDTLPGLAREVGSSTYCLVITRGHAHDEEALYHLAPTAAGYVGMIGSKRKIRLIYEDLLAKGAPQEALERVQAPLGLPIGAQTVPEIAVSIMAELIAWRNLGPSPHRPRTRSWR